jgi:hypothetical protein
MPRELRTMTLTSSLGRTGIVVVEVLPSVELVEPSVVVVSPGNVDEVVVVVELVVVVSEVVSRAKRNSTKKTMAPTPRIPPTMIARSR